MIDAPITQAKHYSFTVWGSSSNGQKWEVSGTTQCEFVQVLDHVMRQTFQDLTAGKAIFGQPGIGCQGPYDVTKVLIEQVRQ